MGVLDRGRRRGWSSIINKAYRLRRRIDVPRKFGETVGIERCLTACGGAEVPLLDCFSSN